MINAVVWKTRPWELSKFNGSLYMRVAFKPIDGSKQVYLNLTKNTEDAKWQNWMPYLKEGNVLSITMHPSGHVNQFAEFRPVDIKPVNKD
jgi:hypothetical protein